VLGGWTVCIADTEVTADSPGGRHDSGKEEEVVIVVVVLVIVKLLFDSGIECTVDVGV
jgi:hypothetical protein